MQLGRIRITQEQVDLWCLYLILATSVAGVLNYLVIQEYGFILYAIAGFVMSLILIILYKIGFKLFVRITFTTFFTILCALSVQEPYVTKAVGLLVALPAVLGMLLLGLPGLFFSACAMYVFVLMRAGFTGEYTAPGLIISFLMLIGLIAISSYRAETERKIAVENADIAGQAIRVSEERQRALQNEEAKLRASLVSMRRGVILTGPDGKVSLYNEESKKILELEEVPEHFKDLSSIIGNTGDLIQLLENPNAGDEVHIKRETVYKKKILEMSVDPIKVSGNATVIGHIIQLEDVTEEKNLQRSRDEFFSIASHELRTPLTAIRGNTSLILDHFTNEIPNEQAKKLITDVHDASVRLISVVNDFLMTSRLELGKIEFFITEVDMNELITQVVKEMQQMYAEKGLKLIVSIDKQSKTIIQADQDKLHLVLTNLLGNALKFTERGTVTIHVENEGAQLKVSVQDTGSGISETNQSLLFKKFQQASDSILTRDVSRSTGLGLYISKLIIEGMHGKIFLESSEVNEGSTFVFTLPHEVKKD